MKIMTKKENKIEEPEGKYFDLEERTFKFAKDVLAFMKTVKPTIANREFNKQLVRSSSSVGANYIEASNYLGKKDFTHKIGICRKEAKESNYWLRLIEIDKEDKQIVDMNQKLQKEAFELMLIFGSIFRNSKVKANSKL